MHQTNPRFHSEIRHQGMQGSQLQNPSLQPTPTETPSAQGLETQQLPRIGDLAAEVADLRARQSSLEAMQTQATPQRSPTTPSPTAQQVTPTLQPTAPTPSQPSQPSPQPIPTTPQQGPQGPQPVPQPPAGRQPYPQQQHAGGWGSRLKSRFGLPLMGPQSPFSPSQRQGQGLLQQLQGRQTGPMQHPGFQQQPQQVHPQSQLQTQTPLQVQPQQGMQQGSMMPSQMGQAGQLGGQAGGQQQGRQRVTRQPPVDILDEGEYLVLEIELPGARKDDIQLTGRENALQLRAPTRERREEETLLQSERGQVFYQRQIPLGVEIDSEEIEAKFEDGILRVKAPKRDPTSGPRRIQIN